MPLEAEAEIGSGLKNRKRDVCVIRPQLAKLFNQPGYFEMTDEFDLRTVLPLLLPGAIAWAEARSLPTRDRP
jgi:hypothetical protein